MPCAPRLTTCALLVSTLASPVAAQRAHHLELGGFGSFTRFDATLQVDNQIGGGGRLGYFFSNTVALELEGIYQQASPTTGTSQSSRVLFGSASLAFNFGGARNVFYVLGGVTRTDFTPKGTGTAGLGFADNAVHGALGDRIFLSDLVALRLEARGMFVPSPKAATASWLGHIVGSVGLSVFTASSKPVDTDLDGIADRRDACPATPARAAVDPRGCPSDSDGDRVLNGIDTCPNTPAGATVNAQGCPQDGDTDGVYDGIDKCPATPSGAQVTADGCTTDADSDGSPDGLDQCPNTPRGAVVDASGCPTDADRDGVFDGIDRCPNTPAGVEVDTVGCLRAKDTDNDGVDDTKDRCPNTAAGTRVDAAGCPIIFTPERTPVVLRGVTFETGRSALKPESYLVLDEVAQSLIANPSIRIEIAGYTDSTGTAAVNIRLSQARALAVRAYLASKGVNPTRMQAKGYGPADPLAPNNTPEGRSQNRRVELHQLP